MGATDLRQVWFPGNHGNVGGGWQDSGVANLSLAWMMDQLASVGVEFDEATIERVFTRLQHTYTDLAEKGEMRIPHAPKPITSDDSIADSDEPEHDSGPFCGLFSILSTEKHWAVEPICETNVPFRPWGLGAISGSEGAMYKFAGYDMRTPGMYKKPDLMNGQATKVFLEDTHERIHSSVRVRLAVKGLGLNDRRVWEAPALKGRWRLRKTTEQFTDPIPDTVTTWEPLAAIAGMSKTTGIWSAVDIDSTDPTSAVAMVQNAVEGQRPLAAKHGRHYRWVWEYCGPEREAPPNRVMVEEPLGPYERQLLRLASGKPNVYEFAEAMDLQDWN